jgi:hypothetical protein
MRRFLRWLRHRLFCNRRDEVFARSEMRIKCSNCGWTSGGIGKEEEHGNRRKIQPPRHDRRQ